MKVQIDFSVKQHTVGETMIFTDPHRVIRTNKISEVNECLKKVQAYIEEGYYAAGFLSYEAAYAFFPMEKPLTYDFPLLCFGIFSAPAVERNRDLQVKGPITLDWMITQKKEDYLQTVQELQEHIQQGEVEQVNYTVPFQADGPEDPSAYYEQLLVAQQGNYNAFIQTDDFSILSISPELFFQLKGNRLTVKPMKGTAERGLDQKTDRKIREKFIASKKEVHENELILDIMKRELQSVCHDVTLTEAFKLETYPTVYQMTSRLEGNKKQGIRPIDIIQTLFPAGSITGSPKEKAIELISKYEKYQRKVYCGNIGYITPEQDALFNVAIRTVMIENNRAHYNAGGAITQLSEAEKEYKEVETKAKLLNTYLPPFQLLETGLIEKGELFLKSAHLRRLTNSADYFGIPLEKAVLEKKLTKVVQNHPEGKWRLRLLVDQKGRVKTEVSPYEKTTNNQVVLAREPIDENNPFLYHKTTERSHFENYRQSLKEGYLDVLLWNTSGEITEFTIGNVVVEIDGRYLTPPVSSGLLPGTFREQLLRQDQIEEEKITLEDLHRIERFWLINSVRKWVAVELVNR